MDVLFAIFLLLLLGIIIYILVKRNRSRQTDSDKYLAQTTRPTQTAGAAPKELSSDTLIDKGDGFLVPSREQLQVLDLSPEPLSRSEDFVLFALTEELSEQQADDATDLDAKKPEEVNDFEPQSATTLAGTEEDDGLEKALDTRTSTAVSDSSIQTDEGDKKTEIDVRIVSIVGDPQIIDSPETSNLSETPTGPYPKGGLGTPLRKHKRKRRPRRYKPPVLTTPKFKKTTNRLTSKESGNSNERTLPILVRARFQRGELVELSLLPGRNPALPEELETTFGGQKITLVALVDEWFQDINHPQLNELLEKGIEFETEIEQGQLLRWALGGRPLYVLATSNALSGFISTTRLVLGEEHVVLCKRELLQSVRDLITETGSPVPEVFSLDAGIPEGWVCLKNVVPKRPVPQVQGQDILNILRPLPSVEIILENGIRIENSIWLAGYPPKIHIQGDMSIVDSIFIDGVQAIIGDNNEYFTTGWDLPGDHNVYTVGKNKSYTIREVGDGREVWEAHLYPRKGHRGNRAICGPLVFNCENADEPQHPIIVPSKNSALIGAVPGQIYFCQLISGDKALYCGDFLPFPPVWALPPNPFQVDKSLVRVLSVGQMEPPLKVKNFLQLGQQQRYLVWNWSKIILAASRKGLLIDPPTRETEGLWRVYKQHAKAIWKIMR